MPQIAVVALGGNAITRSGQSGTYAEQTENASRMAACICDLRGAGWTVVLVHGNGPQVGNLAIQQKEAAELVPELPLFWLGAMTEGQLGSLLTLALHQAGGGELPGVVSLITHVVVDADDPAFGDPTKPIGPFFSQVEAQEQADEHGWTVGEDSGRGYRRLVASPAPVEIVELGAIRALVEQGMIVVAAGGGGVPVVVDGVGYRGVEAVIDKDLAAQRLANALDADALVLITGVEHVMVDFGTPDARAITETDVEEIARHADDGQFPPGSMGPKIQAAVGFVREGGQVAVITDVEHACSALTGSGGGTRIVAAGARVDARRTGAA